MKLAASDLPLLVDFAPFHGKADKPQSRNALFADFHPSELQIGVPTSPCGIPMKRDIKIVLGIVSVGLIASGVWWTRRTPPAPKESMVSIAARTGDSASVRKAVEAGQFSPDEVRVAVQQEFEHQALARFDDYCFRAPTRKIAKPCWIRRSTTSKSTKSRRERAHRVWRHEAAVPRRPADRDGAMGLSQPTATRARLAEFRVAMDKRRAGRGLPGLFADGLTFSLGKS